MSADVRYARTVRLRDIDTEQAIGAPLPGLPGLPASGLLTPDDNAVIAGYEIGQAERWDISPESQTGPPHDRDKSQRSD